MSSPHRGVAALAAATAALAFAGSTVAATATTFHVHPGQSIQAAIDRARSGDTVHVAAGVYRENLTITKDGLTLKGSGIGATVLMPAATPTASPCNSGPDSVEGICVLGQFDASGNPAQPVSNTMVEGFTIDGFSDFGLLALNAAHTTVARTEARDNHSYGISGFVLSGVTFMNDVAHDNGEPGFYIGDSPNADAVVTGNRAFRNGVGGGEGFGFLFRDSSHGTVTGNRSFGNCAGFVFIDTGENPAPVTGWTASKNYATNNTGACGGGDGPPSSGLGILLGGTDHVTLRSNVVTGNVPSGPSFANGGISLVSTSAIGGTDPTNNLVASNVARNNQPVDIFWDRSGSGNGFRGNACGTSQPRFICGS